MSPSSTASSPSSASEKPARQSKTSSEASPRPAARPASKLVLDLQAVADVDGLEEEVSVLRASIRHLASGDGDVDSHVKVLAELRHQIEALCRALKTRQSLVGADGDERAAAMDRALEELDDRPEVEP